MFFCLIQSFVEKEYQTESKRNETFGNVNFGTNVIQRTLTLRQESYQEGKRQGGAPTPPGAPSTLMGPMLLHRRTSSSYVYLRTPQTTRYGAKTLIPPPQPSIPMRSHLGAFSGAPPEGALITEGFYINTIASPMMCEQFTSDLWVHSYQLDGFFSLFGSQYNVLPLSCGDLFDVIFFCDVLRPMNCGFMIKFIYEQYLNPL